MKERPRAARRRRAGALIGAVALAASVLVGCTARPPYVAEGCAPTDRGGRSVARIWDEELLELVRQVVPAPTVHARNLFHLSAAMWDAWAAYDSTADGFFVTEKHRSGDIQVAREAAISYAAYRILLWRYATMADLQTAQEQLDATMASLCYRTDVTTTEGDSPAAVGNRIAAAVLAVGRTDGALEDDRYRDPSYISANDPLEARATDCRSSRQTGRSCGTRCVGALSL